MDNYHKKGGWQIAKVNCKWNRINSDILCFSSLEIQSEYFFFFETGFPCVVLGALCRPAVELTL
jgi:hypothetical protein